MPGMPHLVMKHWDPMIGIDVHIPTIPAPPGKGPPAPFAVFDDAAKARYFGGLSIFMFSMIGIVLDDSGAHAPSELELVEHFRARLHNIRAAVQFAKSVVRGGVEIS